MPLDSQRKINHIQALTLRSFQGRQKTVVFVSQTGGSYSYTAVSVILRPVDVIDPQIPTITGGVPRQQFDTLLIAPIGTSFVGVLYVADTPTATASAVAAAQKYEIIESVPVGIVPGGTHIRCLLRRLR